MATDVAVQSVTEDPTDGPLLAADSDQRPTLSIVMPTLNEEAGVAECIQRAMNAVEELGMSAEIIISDSSTDRTPEIARELGATVVTPDRPGYGYAYRYAFERARGDYIAIGDADTTYDFEELPKLLNQLLTENADMVMGSRFEGEILPGAMPPLHQYVGNPMLTAFLNTCYGAGVSDAHSGFRIITDDALDRLELGSDGMEFASEMIMEAGARGLDITERPITYHPREGEATLESFRDGWRHIEFMLMNAPGYLFTLPGAVLAGFGWLVMSVVALEVGFGGVTLGTHAAIAGGLLSVVGTQVASLGLLTSGTGAATRRTQSSLVDRFVRRATWRHGTLAGLAMFLVGSMYASFLVYRWATTGFTRLPFVTWDIVAFTIIVLGVQLVFSSCFANAVAE